MPTKNASFLAVSGPNESSCGYCHSAGDTSRSFGVWAYHLTVAHYQLLVDKGWRRSGKYLYKPDPTSTCCPAYTIRLDVTRFRCSKGNKKVLKKMKRWRVEGAGRRTAGERQTGVEADMEDEPAAPTERVVVPDMPAAPANLILQPQPVPAAQEAAKVPSVAQVATGKKKPRPALLEGSDVVELVREAEGADGAGGKHRIKVGGDVALG
ncbi:arginine-tRNA-protein transferase [Blyttiomyces helicus]|uniref:Arginine-tRNA-protein transferase n=1 Tax=Blyttiomyces helicus TaxID=388810 RepID=A0A4P9W7L4_9FUNG|nr:arginine-tRNA-protein transferase [Blyttiomyces helicus]|eukprot:RKO88354.1 arginine-tRNA-protein transferase [Blyttiomyces helicus]